MPLVRVSYSDDFNPASLLVAEAFTTGLPEGPRAGDGSSEAVMKALSRLFKGPAAGGCRSNSPVRIARLCLRNSGGGYLPLWAVLVQCSLR